MQTRRSSREIFRPPSLLPLAALPLVADASAAMPDVAWLVSSPWGAWTGFTLAVALVIVLLLWHAIDGERLDAPHRDDARRRGPVREPDDSRRTA